MLQFCMGFVQVCIALYQLYISVDGYDDEPSKMEVWGAYSIIAFELRAKGLVRTVSDFMTTLPPAKC